MRTFALQLKLEPQAPPEKASAWFLPVAAPRAWLDEAIATGIPLEQLRLLIVPTSELDLAPSGALLTAESEFSAGKTCTALPCINLGNHKLYYPYGAALNPPVTPAELESALPSDCYFLHPTLGLTGFDEDARLSILDLLEPPFAQASDWSHAHPGQPPIPRLTSVELALSESLEDLLDPGREDIGTREQDELPKIPGEKDGTGTGAGSGILGGILRGIVKATSKAPATANRRTWINHLQDWAQRRLDSFNFLPEQQKEIERLLHLLENNPDEGLKFAMPLGSGDARGMADPSTRLGRRNPDFSLRNLGGAGSYSPWHLDWQSEQRLAQKYREAANRELRLGRYRRAAYIFAELLNDRASAANALRQGQHFREAAILYRDHLHQPLDAAACFRRAGMIQDAIAIYETEKKFEILGDLYRELDREDDARAAYRREVTRFTEEVGLPVRAANLLEHKLAAPEEALALLHDSWPNSNSAADCLCEEFALLARLARPAAADARVTQVATDTARRDVIPLVLILTELGNSYFNPSTRALAKDAARVVTGKNLNGFPISDQKMLLTAIQQTEKHDLLLGRDTRRFTEQAAEKDAKKFRRPVKKPSPPIKPAPDSVSLVDRTRIDTSVRWVTAAPAKDGYYRAGFTKSKLWLTRVPWNEPNVENIPWEIPPARFSSLHLVPDQSSDNIWVYSGQQFLDPSVSDHANLSSKIGMPGALGLAPGVIHWTIEISDGDLMLGGRDPSTGHLLATHSLSLLPPGIDKDRIIRELGFIPMVSQKDQVIFAIGNHVGRLFRDKIEWVELPQRVLALHPSPPHTKLRIAATLPHGGAVLWADSEWGAIELVAPELANPVATFVRSGRLILATAGIAKSFVLVQQNVIPQHEISLVDTSPPIGIIDQDLRNFYVVTAKQELHYRFATN